MKGKMDTIEGFEQYLMWVKQLAELEEIQWTKPIAEGKWSIIEIIAHMTNWDRHLIQEVLPAVRRRKGMEFPEFNSFNAEASDYARSGVGKSKLLEEAVQAREELVKELIEMSEQSMSRPLTSNGESCCPYTGTPYSLQYIIEEFIEHDHHHQRQVIQFLDENKLDPFFNLQEE